MSNILHFAVDVRGMLLWSEDDVKGLFKRDDGTEMTGREVKHRLMDLLQEGVLYLQDGSCDNWSPTEGCLGHKVEATDACHE